MTMQHLYAIGTLALAATFGGAAAQAADTPQYGGGLEIINYYSQLNALSWDPADFAWKINQDIGHVYDSLIVGDLDQAQSRGGKYSFEADAWLPPDAQRGELAERWEVKEDPLRVEITLREGVMFPEKPGVMQARELVAEDVAYSLNRMLKSPRAIPRFYDFVERVEASGPRQVTLFLSRYDSDWPYLLGYGYYTQIYPREVVDKGINDWRNANGSGPFKLANYTQGNSANYTRNPDYWGKAAIDGKEYRLPFVDAFTYRTVSDESTRLSLLRTGRVDIMENIRWNAVEELKKSAPQLQWRRALMHAGNLLALRNDTKPFDDVRVRRAMNMAVNKREIIDALYGGDAELLAFPMHPDYLGIYQPLDEMPDEIRQLFTYDPDGAKKLLAEAGYPKGFKFQAQVCACNPNFMELMPLLAAYYEQIGVTMEIVPMEYAAIFSSMNSRKHLPGYIMQKGLSNPVAALRNSYTKDDPWNTPLYDNPAFEQGLQQAMSERDDARRGEILRELTRTVLSDAPFVYLPTPYVYRAWWPWVKNYGGELFAGAVRPGPVYARIWIDQDLKKRMGY